MEPKGAYYGMVQPHPIHPVVDGAFVAPAVMDETPFNATEHSIRDALRLAHTALDNYRRTRKDPVEDALQTAVDALTTALSLELNGGAKCS